MEVKSIKQVDDNTFEITEDWANDKRVLCWQPTPLPSEIQNNIEYALLRKGTVEEAIEKIKLKLKSTGKYHNFYRVFVDDQKIPSKGMFLYQGSYYLPCGWEGSGDDERLVCLSFDETEEEVWDYLYQAQS